MSTDEVLIDEICSELQQLCTELEKVREVSGEIYDSGMLEKKRFICASDGGREVARQVRQSNALKQNNQRINSRVKKILS